MSRVRWTWLALLGAVAALALLPAVREAMTTAAPAVSPAAPASATPAALAKPDQRTATPPQQVGSPLLRSAAEPARLRVLDWHGDPVAVRIEWLGGDRAVAVDCPIAGVPVPEEWREVAITLPNWLPVHLQPADLRAGSAGCIEAHLPPPALIAEVLVPAGRESDVALTARLDSRTVLPLECRSGQLEIGGVAAAELALETHGELLIRRPDGHVLAAWHTELPNRSARVELCAPPTLRITPVVVEGPPPDAPELHIEQFDLGGTSLGTHDVPARLGEVEVVSIHGGARRVDVRATSRSATDGNVLVAASRVVLHGGDEEFRLEIGGNRFEVHVQDERGEPIAGAIAAEWNDLLGTTDARGVVRLASVLAGPIDFVAAGCECTQATLPALRRDPVVVLRRASRLLIDGRAAARALPGAQLTVCASFAPACSSALVERYRSLWGSPAPSGEISESTWVSDSDRGGEQLEISPRGVVDQQWFALDAARELELGGMFRPDTEVQLELRDLAGAATGVERTVKLSAGQVTRVVLPTPSVQRFVGQVVRATDGRRLAGAIASLPSSWFGDDDRELADAALDLTVAADSKLTLSHPDCLPRSWERPEPDGLYRLTPARALRLKIVDAAGSDVLVTGVRCRDGTQREFTVACSPTASPAIAPVPLTALTAMLERADGTVATFDVPADVAETTLVWR
ncbi:MAG: hypothetical protein KDE27_01410 [Planctomycetes bacterium]|nr:hypothetical protein [Planctomycetota bacterium]